MEKLGKSDIRTFENGLFLGMTIIFSFLYILSKARLDSRYCKQDVGHCTLIHGGKCTTTEISSISDLQAFDAESRMLLFVRKS